MSNSSTSTSDKSAGGASSAAAIESLVMACDSSACNFKAQTLHRRAPGDHDILVDVKYCGVCHSDLHTAAAHLKVRKTEYPCVPGHEVAGVAVAVGSKVANFKIGDFIGIGCMVDSCLSCTACKAGDENHCKKGSTGTYQGKDKYGRAGVCPPGSPTLGGYSKNFVIHEKFAVKIPPTYPLAAAGPVFCAGITMYSPLKRFKVVAGSRVGIVGLGGLGVMGVKIAKALGCTVTAISRSAAKKDFAVKVGADKYCSTEPAAAAPVKEQPLAANDDLSMAAHKGSLDIILNTVPSQHDYAQYLPLLDPKSKIKKQVMLGLHNGFVAGMALPKMTFGKSRIVSSMIGNVHDTQEVIDLCAKHNIVPETEIVGVEKLNQIYEMLDKNNDKGVRYVLDIEKTLKEGVDCGKEHGGPPAIAPSAGLSLGWGAVEALKMFFKGKW